LVNTSEPLVTVVQLAQADTTVGYDLWAKIECSTGVEFYGLQPMVNQTLPPIIYYYENRPETTGSERKRFSGANLLINTFGNNVTVLPILDGVELPVEQTTVNTTEPLDTLVQFVVPRVGKDLWYRLTAPTGFEFYKITPAVDQTLPAKHYYFENRPAENNPTWRRFGGVTLLIDTLGTDCKVTPIIDGIKQTETVINNNGPGDESVLFSDPMTTVGRDLWVQIESDGGFEFYTFTPIVLHNLPPLLTYWDSGEVDVGPEDLTWIREIRLRVHATEDLIVTPYFDSLSYGEKTITVTPNQTKIYALKVGREYKGGQPRIAVNSTKPFFLYWCEFVPRVTGNATNKKAKRIKLL